MEKGELKVILFFLWKKIEELVVVRGIVAIISVQTGNRNGNVEGRRRHVALVG